MRAAPLSPETLLTVLQLGDSFFPSGAAAFSWGLETLQGDGHLRRGYDDLAQHLIGQLRHRWASFDRPVLVAARRAAARGPKSLAEVDQFIAASSLAREMREGTARMGAALLRVHAQLGVSSAASYLVRVRAGQVPGQLVAVQGLVAHACKLDAPTTCALSAYGFCAAQASAALRLGLIGHLDAQRLLLAVRPMLAQLLAEPVPALADVHAYVPATDIALMRHESGVGRLFAN